MARRLGRIAVPAVVLLLGVFNSPGLVGQQRRQDGGVAANFAADGAFTGSSLAGWRPVGDASWRAENGEIVATTKAGGWLLADKSYEDVDVVAAFRCTGACSTGVLVRAEPTADGGTKGIFVSVTGEDRASYRVTLDAQGRETSRERLRPPAPGQLRVAPPPPATAPAPPASGGRPPAGPPPMPGGIPSPIARPEATVKAGEWNTIEVVLDANIVRAFLNDAAGIRDGVADAEFGAYGAIGFYAGGEGEVRFRKVAFKDLPALEQEGAHTLDEMWTNISYFLKAVVPEAEKAGVRLALHPNDPPAPLSRKSQQIMGTLAGWKKLITIVNSASNGITFDCGVTRELGEDPMEVCRYFGSRDRINHVHFRNVMVKKPYERYTEVWIDEGENNMFAVMRELVKQKYTRLIYPEHPRGIDYDRERQGFRSQYPGGGGYAAFAFNVGYARAMLQAALTA